MQAPDSFPLHPAPAQCRLPVTCSAAHSSPHTCLVVPRHHWFCSPPCSPVTPHIPPPVPALCILNPPGPSPLPPPHPPANCSQRSPSETSSLCLPKPPTQSTFKDRPRGSRRGGSACLPSHFPAPPAPPAPTAPSAIPSVVLQPDFISVADTRWVCSTDLLCAW